MRFDVKTKVVKDGDDWKREVGVKALWLNPNEPDPYEWRWMDTDSVKALIRQLEDSINETPLLPCPFCDSNEVYYREDFEVINPGEWGTGLTIRSVECNKCGAEIFGKNKADAVRKWNTRRGKPYDRSD